MYRNTNFSNCKIKWKKRFLFQTALFVISFVPARNYLFKVSNLRTRITYESSLILRMSMLKIFNVNDVSGVVLVSLLLTVDIFQTFFKFLTLNRQKFAWFKLKIQNTFINKLRLNLYHRNPTGESVRNFCEGVCFRH